VVDPIEDEIEKFQEVLVKGVGLKVVAIADHDTPFTTSVFPPPAKWIRMYSFVPDEPAGWDRTGQRH